LVKKSNLRTDETLVPSSECLDESATFYLLSPTDTSSKITFSMTPKTASPSDLAQHLFPKVMIQKVDDLVEGKKN